MKVYFTGFNSIDNFTNRRKEMITKYISLLILAGLFLFSCSTKPAEDQKFESLADHYLQKLIQMNPEWATSLGDHRYDHLLNDYSLDGIS